MQKIKTLLFKSLRLRHINPRDCKITGICCVCGKILRKKSSVRRKNHLNSCKLRKNPGAEAPLFAAFPRRNVGNVRKVLSEREKAAFRFVTFYRFIFT